MTTDLPPEEQVVPAMLTCPGCGVAVAVGYPRCPRCHAAVPQPSRSRRQTFREEMIAGGTSLEPPVEAARSWPWLVAAALVIAALVAWVASRDGDRAPPAGAGEAAAEPAEDDLEETVDDGEDEADVAAGPVGGEIAPPGSDDLDAVIRRLDGALREERLWSKVSAEGDAVVIESAQCADRAILAVAADHAAELRAAGARTLRCQEPHGAVVFDRGL